MAEIDDDPAPMSHNISTRSRRANAGAGIDRIQMDFQGKVYEARSEFNFVMNEKKQHPVKAKTENDTCMKIACEVIFTQMAKSKSEKKYGHMSAKAGFKKFDQAAVAVMIKEFTQLNEGSVPGKPVIMPVDTHTLTLQEKVKALPAVNLIKEKRNGDIKGRTFINGSKQRKYLKQDESIASPTASLESLITTSLIDAYKGRDVATYDIPGASRF